MSDIGNNWLREKAGFVTQKVTPEQHEGLRGRLEELAYEPHVIQAAIACERSDLDAASTANALSEVEPSAGQVAAEALGARWREEVPPAPKSPYELSVQQLDNDLRAALGK